MRIGTTAVLTAAALAIASLPASAEPPRHHGPGHQGVNPVLHMTRELGLSDSQSAEVTAITAKYDEGGLGKAKNAMPDARANLHRTIHDVLATDAQVREAAASVALLDAQAAVEHHRMAIEISAVLTADQRTKLAAMFARMKARHEGPGGGGGF